MKPGGNADKSGQLVAEDRLLNVNGVDVSVASREDCIAALKLATSKSTTVMIQVKRVSASENDNDNHYGPGRPTEDKDNHHYGPGRPTEATVDMNLLGTDRYIFEMMNRTLWNPYMKALQGNRSSRI